MHNNRADEQATFT